MTQKVDGGIDMYATESVALSADVMPKDDIYYMAISAFAVSMPQRTIPPR